MKKIILLLMLGTLCTSQIFSKSIKTAIPGGGCDITIQDEWLDVTIPTEDVINTINVYTMGGTLVLSASGCGSYHCTVSIINLQAGNYRVEVISSNGRCSRNVQK